MGWNNYLSIPKLQRLHCWSLGMDRLFHSTLHTGCNYLSMLGSKLNHVSKRSPCYLSHHWFWWWLVCSAPSQYRKQWWLFVNGTGHLGKISHSQNTASTPSHPIQHPTAGQRTPLTPMGLVMAGCWQINYILANICRRKCIRILNQYPFFWNILIWAQFICFFLKLFAF